MSSADIRDGAIVCVTFLSSTDSLLFFRRFRRQDGPEADDVALQMILHASLDQAVARLGVMQRRYDTWNLDPFLGILTPALFDDEYINVYGYVSTTRVKILVAVHDDLSIQSAQQKNIDDVMRSLFRHLNALYIDAVSNPFYDGLEKVQFEVQVTKVVEHHVRLLSQRMQSD